MYWLLFSVYENTLKALRFLAGFAASLAAIQTTQASDELTVIAALDGLSKALQEVQSQLGQIIQILTPAQVAGTRITIENGDNMASKAKASAAGMDFQLLDSGKAVATISFIDAAGLPTTAQVGATIDSAWTSSDPAVVVTGRSDGLNADLAPSVPPVLATGVIVTATTTITNSDGSTLGPFTATGDPIDVVVGGPAGMKIAESADAPPPTSRR
jgi:hypothetical protein